MHQKLIILFLFSIQVLASDIYFRDVDDSYTCHKYIEKLESILEKNLTKPFVFFIHGRGKHPEKGIGYLPEFEDYYKIKIAMFHWDSWKNGISRPEKNAKESSQKLSVCLNNLFNLKNEKPHLFNQRKTILMTHSMGTIVLMSFLKSYKLGSWGTNLFDVTLMNAPDVPSKGHYLWTDKALDFSSKVFVTNNLEDLTLIGSKFIDIKDIKIFRGNRLGATRYNYFFLGRDLSKKINYLDFTKLSFVGHEYFLNSKNTFIPQVYKSIFTGEKDLIIPFKRKTNNPNILIFNKPN